MTTLKQLIERSGAIDVRRAARYVGEVAGQLGALHDAKQRHLAVRPSLIAIDPQGGAQLLPRPEGEFKVEASDPVDHEAFYDQVDYWPPELALSLKRCGPAADLYGLGGTLYYLLLARPPFPGPFDYLSELLVKHQVELPEEPIRLRVDLPKGLSDLCLRMLAKRPGDRPESADEVRRRLAPYM